MSIKVMTRVWESAPVNFGSLLVMLALADFSDDHGRSYPAVGTLALKARLTARQVQRILRELESLGLLRTETNAGPHGTNVYVIVGGDNLSGVTNDPEGVSQMSPEPSLNREAQHSIETLSLASRKSSTDNSGKTKPRARGLELLNDDAFIAEIEQRFPDRDTAWESAKWLDHIEASPPKGNYKNSLRNWIERSPVKVGEDQDRAWLRERYARGKASA